MKFLLWDDDTVRHNFLSLCCSGGTAEKVGEACKIGQSADGAPLYEDWRIAEPITTSEPPRESRTQPLFVDKSGLLQEDSIGPTSLTSSTAPGISFADAQELRAHYKSDYHRYNLKKKLSNQPLVSLSEFERLIEEGFSSLSASSSSSSPDVSSSESSTDNESEENASTGSHFNSKGQVKSSTPGRATPARAC